MSGAVQRRAQLRCCSSSGRQTSSESRPSSSKRSSAGINFASTAWGRSICRDLCSRAAFAVRASAHASCPVIICRCASRRSAIPHRHANRRACSHPPRAVPCPRRRHGLPARHVSRPSRASGVRTVPCLSRTSRVRGTAMVSCHALPHAGTFNCATISYWRRVTHLGGSQPIP